MFFGLEKLKTEFDVRVHWRSYELRPAGSPPVPPEYKARIEAARPRFAQSMRDELGVDIVSGPFGIDSRPALVLGKYAEAQGVGDAFHIATLEAYWQRGEDISDRDVLGRLAAGAGLDAAAIDSAIADPAMIDLVDADIAQAREYGLDGVPAVVLDNKYLVMGAQPYDTFVSAVKRAQAG